jgi:hypothetical protein
MAVADTTHTRLRAERRRATLEALAAVLAELGADVIARHDAGESVLLRMDEWNSRLRDAIYSANRTTASAIAARVASDLGADFDPVVMDAWLLENAAATAAEFNDATASDLEAATAEPESEDIDPAAAVAAAVVAAQGYRLQKMSNGLVSVSSAFGSAEAARATGRSGDMVKRWKVNSSNPRASHRRLNGEEVPYGERFSNRLRWPGDAKSGDADELANCKCSVVFVIR